MTGCKMKDIHYFRCRKNIYLQSMKENRFSVCIMAIEMYCDNRNVL